MVIVVACGRDRHCWSLLVQKLQNLALERGGVQTVTIPQQALPVGTHYVTVNVYLLRRCNLLTTLHAPTVQ